MLSIVCVGGGRKFTILSVSNKLTVGTGRQRPKATENNACYFIVGKFAFDGVQKHQISIIRRPRAASRATSVIQFRQPRGETYERYSGSGSTEI